MSVKRFMVTDPTALVSQVEPNRLSSLSKRGDGNRLILESIVKNEEVLNLLTSEEMSPVLDTSLRLTAALTNNIKDLAKNGLGIDFSDTSLSFSLGDFQGGELGALFDEIGSGFDSLSGLGDVLGINSLFDVLDGMSLNPGELILSLVPNFVGNLLSGFDIDKLVPNASDALQDYLMKEFVESLIKVDPDWYWHNKSLKLYRYEVLSKISPWARRALDLDGRYVEPMKLSTALYKHRYNV